MNGDEDTRRLAAVLLENGDPTDWFEQLYAEAQDGTAVVGCGPGTRPPPCSTRWPRPPERCWCSRPWVTDGPPWPLTRAAVEAFAVDGVALVSADEVPGDIARWRAVFSR